MSEFNEELPGEIRVLVGRCEIGETRFSNDEMSVALKFGEMLWRRLAKMAEHYERQSKSVMPEDLIGKALGVAAEDMRHVLADCRKDL